MVSVPDYGELILNCQVLDRDLKIGVGESFRPRLRGTNLKRSDPWFRVTKNGVYEFPSPITGN